MASIASSPDGRRRIIFTDPRGGKRKTLRLGPVSVRDAESVRVHVERLVAAALTQGPPPDETSRWIASLPDLLRKRFEAVGLVESRKRRECPTLAAWIRSYIEGRTDAKPGTIINLAQTERNLAECFGPDKRLADFTAADAERFKTFLKEAGLAEATLRRRCKRARQFFAAAVKRRILDANPFAALPCGDFANAARSRFVTLEETEAVLTACPDCQWRLIFGLARYAGLRCPSEILALRWEDVDFARARFVVHSAKTEHAGTGVRTVPLFPTLGPLLQEVFDAAEPGAEYVITRYRRSNANLRTQLTRIIKRAGLESWPRLFANLRASAEADLAEKWPLHVCAQWLGHSPRVALSNYLRAKESDYQEAAGKAARNPARAVQFRTVQDGSEKDEKSGNPLFPHISENISTCLVTPTGLEPVSRP